jgi:adenylate kinase family enzyme
MDKILIIGINGAGKSTLANNLGKKLNREVIHLDKLYYQSGWQHTQTKEEWRGTVKNLISKEKWIMDGHYNSTLDIRIPAADTIIFFNFNKLLCIYRIVKRIFSRIQPFDKIEGNKEKISFDLIKKIIKFPKKKILRMLEPYKNIKQIIIFKNDGEVEKYLSTLLN